MNQESRICQNCKNEFVIEPEDFAFYEKMKVPAPTWCPECRMIRRMLWRNESVWYRRKCDATGKNILSMIAQDAPYKVYDQAYWKSDAWDPLSYGREYNFQKPFFEQFKELLVAIPHPNLVQKNSVNSDYGNYAINAKNCYFVTGCDTAEDSAYIFAPNLRIRGCFDVHAMGDSESCYESVDIEKSQGLRFCQSCVGCSDSYFLYDCRNCMNCFGCVGLRNKQFYIFNEPHSREDYSKKLESLSPWTISGIAQARKNFEKLKLNFPRKYAIILKSERVTGDDIINANNCHHCFFAKNDIQNCKYSFRLMNGAKDIYDAATAWNGAELFYEVSSATGQRIMFSAFDWGGFDILYSYNCFDCNNIFGCVGLRNKSYCILNKQYTKEEYEMLVSKIIEHMNAAPYVDKKGRVYKYGEFFPAELSLFAYNETQAQNYFAKTKEEVQELGFRWRDPESKKYEVTIKNDKIPEDIRAVSDSIVNEVLECSHKGECLDHCATAFRIVPQELQFLKKMGVPLPRLCPLCRQGERLRLKNPLRLWHRKCMKPGCTNEFETSYAPNRPEIIYCESCYNAEVA